MEKFQRGAGVLCHISSLPGKYGIGTFGKSAYEFADFLVKAKVKYWQILPLTQTGFGDSPYQSVCCNSGNPYFIDPDILHGKGLLTDEELQSISNKSCNVNYAGLYNERYKTLRKAFLRFNRTNRAFTEFKESGEFNDYALFMTLKNKLCCTIDNFPDEYKYRDGQAIQKLRSENADEYEFWLFLQFEFKQQWLALKNYVNSLGIRIIGDIPLYVAYDSSDVWANPELFMLDERLNPVAVAGVPPDYFSKTGQLWGNPLYDWQEMSRDNFAWWVERVKKASVLYDIIRIDHFRGLDRFYAIPADSDTAQAGEWLNGPRFALFEQIENALGSIPVIAEDLGVLDDGVFELIQKTGFPGMKILQFAFNGAADNAYLPANISENSVTYTGTHDNDTVLGFLNAMTEEEYADFKIQLCDALESEGIQLDFNTKKQTVWAVITCALATRSALAVVPVQDILCLNEKSRMNIPSTRSGNWQFRLSEIPSDYVAAKLKRLIIKSSR